MKNNASVALFGFLFALGLGVSGMTETSKVIGFLDLFGTWDPSLIFVMIGAIAVHSIAYRIIRKRSSPVFSSRWYLSDKTKITGPLVVGSVIFGIGWGLAGYCPGPAIVSLVTFQAQPLLFGLGLVAGTVLCKWKFS